jgi:hypothetical protein
MNNGSSSRLKFTTEKKNSGGITGEIPVSVGHRIQFDRRLAGIQYR